MAKLTPLNDNVIVKAFSKEEVTASGIVLPETAIKEKPQEGEVIAVGPGKLNNEGQRVPVGIEVGKKVLFKKYSPDEFEIDKIEYLVLRADDIIAIVE